MFKNHQVVCCTAAGRRRYMQYIFPYIVTDPIVDRYDIWVNTVNMEDIEFFRQMAARYPKIRLVMQPDGVVDGIKSINAFYKFCCEPETIYMKIDDDVIWMEQGIIEKMADFRLSHPDAFLVSPMVINNVMCSYVWQVQGKLSYGRYATAAANHRHLWKRGYFAANLHQWFLKQMMANADFFRSLYVVDTPWAMNRLSITFVVWCGEQMAAINGIVPGDDEEYLSCIRPTELGKANWLRGDALISHFSFGPQRDVLDKANILEQYDALLANEFSKNDAQRECFAFERELIADIARRAAEIRKQPCPYRKPRKSTWQKVRAEFKSTQRSIRNYIDAHSKPKFTVKPNI